MHIGCNIHKQMYHRRAYLLLGVQVCLLVLNQLIDVAASVHMLYGCLCSLHLSDGMSTLPVLVYIQYCEYPAHLVISTE